MFGGFGGKENQNVFIKFSMNIIEQVKLIHQRFKIKLLVGFILKNETRIAT